MSLATVTYGTMISQVTIWIKTYCKNIADFNNLESCFKSGYSATGSCTGTFPYSNLADKYTVTLIGNAVSSVGTGTVDTQMNEFWTNYCGGLNTSLPISPTNYLGFIQDMTSFCSARVFMAVSEYCANKYLVYYSGSTTYSDYVTLSSAESQYRFVTATDVAYNAEGILYNIINATNKTIRLYPARYSTTIA